MLKARCLSSSPIPKYGFGYSCLLWKMFSDEPEFEKKCWLWALNMRHSCVSYLGSFFFLKEDIHITHIFSILAFVNARMDKFLSNIPVQLNLSADIYSAGATKHSLGILVNTYTLWLCDTHKELYCKDFKIARPGRLSASNSKISHKFWIPLFPAFKVANTL